MTAMMLPGVNRLFSHAPQRAQAADRLRAGGHTAALFAHREQIVWLTGFARPIELDLHHFAGAPPVLAFTADAGGPGHDAWTLIAADVFASDITCADGLRAFAAEPGCTVVAYPTYTVDAPIRSADHAADAVQRAAEGWRGRSVGFERDVLPARLAAAMRDGAGDAAFAAIDGLLSSARAVKTADEWGLLLHNFALADLGHAAAREYMAGHDWVREIDVFAAVQSVVSRAAGRRVPLGNDFVASTRPFNIGGWGLDRGLGPHDSIMIDLSTGDGGYWSDSCATYYADRTAEQLRMWDTVLNALAETIAIVRPGVRACDLDARARAVIEKAGYPPYPHHTGHGVGAGVHEWPRIVAYETAALTEGMCIMLEPGIYMPGLQAARAEVGVRVTADGAEVLNHHLDGWGIG
jgi:Xaa-Pro aminopeptidase